LPSHFLEPPVAVTMEIYGLAMLPVPAAEGIVAEDETMAV
jgi:hypothetical protein